MLSAPAAVAQPLPCVALVGRANVGKSTLFNRLVGRRVALVHNAPHVTRDRLFGTMRSQGKVLQVIDTGGLRASPAGVAPQLAEHVQAQTLLAIAAADLVLLVVDGQVGVLPDDVSIAQQLRRAGKKIAVLVNKIDTPAHAPRLDVFYALGFATVLPVSAEHARGLDALDDYLCTQLQPPAATDALPSARSRLPQLSKEQPIYVAVVGRPNAGKSSLINRFLGEERHVACAIPGVTRDAVDSPWCFEGQKMVLIDTAGIRRKRAIEHKLEQFAVVAAFNSLDRADVVVLLLDGTVAPTEQDARIAALAHNKGRGLILAVNKWELVENPAWQRHYVQALRAALPFADYAPVISLSAKTGAQLEVLAREVIAVQQARYQRITTGELNRFFREVVQAHPPPRQGGQRPQLYFVSQPLICPPTFVFASNRMDKIHFSYSRYLVNALRQRYGFSGTPLWVKFRQRERQAPRCSSSD